MTAAYDHEAMWAKAKVFLNRAMDPGPERSFDERALWAAAALELLAKAALARVSPLLIAEPTVDGTSLLIATGLIKDTARFTSVSASTVFKRCQRAFRPFSAPDAQMFADARNEYLHGSGVGFMAIPPQEWWPRYWALADILVSAQDRGVADLVGPGRVREVEDYLAQNARNVEQRTEALITRARQRLDQYRAGTLPARIQAEWRANPGLGGVLPYYGNAECPACGAVGILEGEDGSNQLSLEYYSYDREDGPALGATATLDVPVEYFSCSTCHLVLNGYELTRQAGLPDSFEFLDTDPAWPEEEPDYGND